ncbi:MAG: amylo-alpha-1,6-glucosidase, partial [Bacteroidales bacterium]|nr:amylo-alpha-1,6-glucosidase [Bacteroidales bacterium]
KYVSHEDCIKRYGKLIEKIMEFLRQGKHPNLFVHNNGLVYTNGRDKAVTWMNSSSYGRPIIPRSGYVVEINALWYNALVFGSNLLEEFLGETTEVVTKIREQAALCAKSFREVFLNEHGYLLDYVDGSMMDWSVRPNMIFAAALDYSPLEKPEKKKILDICTKELLTPKGLRSLSPKSGGYNPMYTGPQSQRDYAYHMGTAWPWLEGFYLEAYLKLYQRSGLSFIDRQLVGFEDQMTKNCISTLPEMFDGNPPFRGRGAMSFAMNVAEILRIYMLLRKYKEALG